MFQQTLDDEFGRIIGIRSRQHVIPLVFLTDQYVHLFRGHSLEHGLHGGAQLRVSGHHGIQDDGDHVRHVECKLFQSRS